MATENKLGSQRLGSSYEGVQKSVEYKKPLLAKFTQVIANLRSTRKVTNKQHCSLDQMISLGEYDWVDSRITTEHFPIFDSNRLGDILFYCFKRNIPSDEVVSRIRIAGYEPCDIVDLLVLGINQPKFQQQFSIVALGSTWQPPNDFNYVPCLYGNIIKRNLGLCHLNSKRPWNKHYRFLCRHK